jgi:hypothetical protein
LQGKVPQNAIGFTIDFLYFADTANLTFENSQCFNKESNKALVSIRANKIICIFQSLFANPFCALALFLQSKVTASAAAQQPFHLI